MAISAPLEICERSSIMIDICMAIDQSIFYSKYCLFCEAVFQTPLARSFFGSRPRRQNCNRAARQYRQLRRLHLDEWCHVFHEWPLNAVLRKKLSLRVRSFRRKYCTIKDGARPNLRFHCRQKLLVIFSIILKVLSGWEVIRTQGKCIKSYKKFWKEFVVEQNLTFRKGDFWSYVNRP